MTSRFVPVSQIYGLLCTCCFESWHHSPLNRHHRRALGAENGVVHRDQLFVPVAIANDREPSILDDIALLAFQRGPSSLILLHQHRCWTTLDQCSCIRRQ